MKCKYKNRKFWCRGYYVDTAGKEAKKISEYIAHQLKEDRLGDLLFFDDNPFGTEEGGVRQGVKTFFKRG
jgi:putative transposase